MTDRTQRPSSAQLTFERPFRLNLEQQKNRAKDLLRAARAADPEALSRFAAVRRALTQHSPETLPVTVKLVDVTAAPFDVCTLIGPVVAPAGTLTTTWVAVSEETFALTPLKVTVAAVKPEPLMVTFAPTAPDFGVKLVMVTGLAPVVA